MHRTVIALMVLELGGRGAAGFRIIRNTWAVIIFMVLEVGGREVPGFRIIRDAWALIFSWFWKWAGGGPLASES